MPLSLLNHSALALFAQRTRIPTSARSIGFCAIWVCISSSSSSQLPGVRAWATLLLDRILMDYLVAHSSALCGRKVLFRGAFSERTEEHSALDRYHHLHGHSGMCTVHLIGFLYHALNSFIFLITCYLLAFLLIPAPRGLC
jgi:hypothetical protein